MLRRASPADDGGALFFYLWNMRQRGTIFGKRMLEQSILSGAKNLELGYFAVVHSALGPEIF
jgi:hypothetical protein